MSTNAPDDATAATIESLLDQLATALNEDRVDDARTLFNQLVVAYDDRRRTEAATVAAAESGQTTEVPYETIKAFAEFSNATSETERLRAQGLSEAASFINNNDGGESSIVEDTIKLLKQREEEYKVRKEEINSQIDSVSLPPSIAIIQFRFISDSTADGEIPVGGQVTAPITIENVGDKSATGVNMQVTGPEAVEITPEKIDVGEIAAGEQAEVEIKLSSQEQGSYRVTAEIASENGGNDTDTVTIIVKTKTVQEYATEEGVIDTTGLRNAVSDWRADRIDTELLREVVDYWRSGETVS